MASNDDVKDLSEAVDEPLSEGDAAAMAGGVGMVKPPKLGAIGTGDVLGHTQVTTDSNGDVDQ